MPYGGVFALP